MRVKISESAEKDLENISDYYVQEAGEFVVLNLFKELKNLVLKLSQFPEMGKERKAYRVFKISKYPIIIIYRINKRKGLLEVSRIFHTSRNIANQSI